LFALLLTPLTSYADSVRIRIGTVAPEGSAWAREIHGFTRDVDSVTAGNVQLKWYMGGIAGNEFTTIERIRKGQLDGSALTLGCEQLAPSLHVMRVVGLIQSREESHYVLGRLRPRVEQEMAKSGFVALGLATFGSIALFTRTPLTTFAALQKTRLWVWDRDDVEIQLLRNMGLSPVPLPIENAAKAYEEGQIDGFTSVPGAALVFQWSTLARYFTDFHLGLLPACFVVSQRAFDAMAVNDRQGLAAAAAKFTTRFNDIGGELDQQLVNGLFEKQGLKRVAATQGFISDFFEQARQVRGKADPNSVPPELLSEVLGWLADYRAEHSDAKARR
jgi:TRAP-type C4-dicarboxylate transport system substrate-binding protein